MRDAAVAPRDRAPLTPAMVTAGRPFGRCPRRLGLAASGPARLPGSHQPYSKGRSVGSVIKKRRKRMAKKKHRKLLKKTRIQRRRQGK